MYGALLYRNQQIIPRALAAFEEVSSTAAGELEAGEIATYFDLGAYYSMPYLDGLGGQWLVESTAPVFQQDDYREALEWIGLLKDFQQTGAAEMNTSRDETLFMENKVGMIVAGSWQRSKLA